MDLERGCTVMEFEIGIEATVRIIVSDDAPADVFTRAGAKEFQDALYGDSVRDKDTTLAHWAYNAVANGISSAHRLDGWGDLDPGVVYMIVDNVLESW